MIYLTTKQVTSGELPKLLSSLFPLFPGKPVIVKKEKKELSDNMLCYYDYMVKAILGADEEAMKVSQFRWGQFICFVPL